MSDLCLRILHFCWGQFCDTDYIQIGHQDGKTPNVLRGIRGLQRRRRRGQSRRRRRRRGFFRERLDSRRRTGRHCKLRRNTNTQQQEQMEEGRISPRSVSASLHLPVHQKLEKKKKTYLKLFQLMSLSWALFRECK